MKIIDFLKKNWKKPKFFIPVIFILIIILFLLFSGKEKEEFSVFEVERGDVVLEVSATGKVQPVEMVDLAFEKNGKIENIFVKVGDKVKSGKILLSLNKNDLTAQMIQAQANYESELAKLKEMEKGTRREEIQSAETAVLNAERSLNDAENKLKIALEKAEVDLNSDYQALLTAIQEGATTAKNALITLSDIQIKYYTGGDYLSRNLSDAKSEAMNALFDVSGGSMGSESISALSSGAFGFAQSLENDDFQSIESSAEEIIFALKKTSNALNIVPITEQLTTTEKTNLSSEKISVNIEITTLSSAQQDVLVQKVLNSSNIVQAETELNSAKNTLATAQDNLNLKIAGYTQEQIDSQSAKVKSAQANLINSQVQLAKTDIKASFSGVITKIYAEKGEIVSANEPVISLISENEFEIETNIAEVDVAKIEVGKLANITLDAYGSSVLFQAEVSEIDPAETIIEGVSTYRTKLIFKESKERIFSGMTANIDILADEKNNVLFIPQRAVFTKNGDKFVRVLMGKEIEEKKIETGLRGSEGTIEIIKGLNEKELVITSY